ncbi:MAG: homocysteine S-methyltransferase family protein [Candidatus Sifarchaeia archaeon]
MKKYKMDFQNLISKSKVLLTEGSMVERINRDPSVCLDPYIAHSGLIYDSLGKEVLEKIYREYIDIGKKYNIPILSLAPTWRANPERIEKSIFSKHENINKDCVEFLKRIRDSYSDYSRFIYIGGLMGCKGDAYDPKEALSEKESKLFHKVQVEQLAESNVDFIKAATLPAVSEAYGIASAISTHDTPYILSFVVLPEGTILDGTPIYEAIDLIDSEIHPKPFFYMVNCVHPTIFEKSICREFNVSNKVTNRILGLQANTSVLSPKELDNLSYLDTADPEEFAELMLFLHNKFGLKVLGGCCGSDSSHIHEIAKRIV